MLYKYTVCLGGLDENQGIYTQGREKTFSKQTLSNKI